MNKRPIGIYVDLDCILDTRMGTIMTIDKDIGLGLIDNREYYEREIDEFHGIDKEIFKERYKKRDKEVLMNSLLTNLVIDLKDMVQEIRDETTTHPLYSGVKVFINTHPYDLSEREIEAIRQVMHTHLYGVAMIEMIKRPLQLVDCMYIKDNLNHLFIYQYNKWLNARQMEFDHKGMADVSVYFPKINWNYVPDKEDIKKQLQEAGIAVEDHFEMVAGVWSVFVQINFIPVEVFSMISDYSFADIDKHLKDDVEE